jgi:serine/threonine protein kinase
VTQPIAPSSFCSRCGAQVATGAHFCTVCGTDVSGEQASLATSQAAGQTRPSSGDIWTEQLQFLRESTLGDYEILGELGRGGMAAVYLAHEFALDRKVAIKVMSPALVTGAGMIERFKREARTAASLSHPHIIPVYAVRETDHLLYFVMKFIAGRPLDGVLKELGPLPIPMIQMILQQVGGAFGYAHRRGIIHRDIKPANIMIDEEGWAVVTDFGIAKVSQAEGLTMTGMTVGTPTYMSPEQCMAQEVTGASDQYSLGVVAYEMITGRPPFSGGSMMAIMYGHFNDPPPDIAALRPDCPSELRQTVIRMLEKDPAKRWPSMEDAVDSIGEPPAKSDDAMRTQLVEIAKKSENTAMLKRYSTPISPTPLTKRSRAGTAKSAAATQGAGLQRGAGRAQPVVSGGPASSGSKTGLFIGLGAVAVVAAVLAVWRPWETRSEAGPTPQVAAAPGASQAVAGGDQQGPASSPATSSVTPPVSEPQSAAAPETEPAQAAPPPTAPAAARPPAVSDQTRREFERLLARHKDARSRALEAGAIQRELGPGDNLRRTAERLASRGEWALAISSLSDGIESYGTAELAAKARSVADARLHPQPAPTLPESTPHLRTEQPPAQQAPAPVQIPAPVATTPTPAPVADERPQVELVLREYARALSAGDLQAMLAVFPGMPETVRQKYKEMFDNKWFLDTSRWRYLDIAITNGTAQARLGGSSVVRNDKGKPQGESPFPRQATLAKGSGGWRLISIE